MSSSSLLHLCLNFNPNFLHGPLPSSFNPNFSPLFPSIPKTAPKSQICFAYSGQGSSNYDREESRWLREEQRWLREEQRWLRQESLWNAERESLLCQIAALELRIKELEQRQGGASVGNIAALLQVLKTEANRIAENGSNSVPLVLEDDEAALEELVAEDVVVKEVVEVSERERSVEVKEVKKKRATLRKGSEGAEVQAMQEALQKIGFYCGEEDEEFSSFSSGTESAVKTWQATFGAPEDGIMTGELLELLYREKQLADSGIPESENGAAVSFTKKISEIQQRVVKEDIPEEISANRVFLLGENRWEDPSRLSGAEKKIDLSRNKDGTMKCLSCRGEGRLLCLECDGTGEPNIEEQFMEWVDEGAKCPYCNGLGYTICDVCEGKPTI